LLFKEEDGLNKAIDICADPKRFLVGPGLKIKVDILFELLAKAVYDSRFAYLPGTPDNQWFAIWFLGPFFQMSYDFSLKHA
jgi:hypothetical protein